MLSEKARAFVAQNHLTAVTSFRRNGAAQISIVTSGPFRDGVAFTTTEDRAKFKNLRRDPRCTMMVSKPDWWGYIVLEGNAEILAKDNTDADELRMALRDVYTAASGTQHPNWDEYDKAMVDEQRVAVLPGSRASALGPWAGAVYMVSCLRSSLRTSLRGLTV